jgi:hypothetical protein
MMVLGTEEQHRKKTKSLENYMDQPPAVFPFGMGPTFDITVERGRVTESHGRVFYPLS